MTTALPASAHAGLAAAGTSTLPGRLDPDRDKDLYAEWQSVFDRARPVQPAPDQSTLAFAADAAGDVPAAEHLAARAAAAPERAASAPACDGAATGVQASQSGAVVLTGAVASLPAGKRGDIDGVGAFWIQPQPMTGLRSGAPLFGADAEHHAVLWQAAAARARESSPDTVSVFVQGTAVAIVVRDAGMSQPDALRCGFETARWLTGRGAALQQLTLNGRVLYQQQARSEPATRALVFAC